MVPGTDRDTEQGVEADDLMGRNDPLARSSQRNIARNQNDATDQDTNDLVPDMQAAAPSSATDTIGTSDDSCAGPVQCDT